MNQLSISTPIRVLCLFTLLDRGGAETMCMNVYRNIDRSKVQFDFLVYYPQRGEYEDEIDSLGGRVYRIPHLDIKNLVSHIRGARQFFIDHPEYHIVHNHMGENGAFICKEAQKADVKTIIFHSHVDLVPVFYKKEIKNGDICKYVFDKKQAKLRLLLPIAMGCSSHYFACGENAARIFRKKKNQAVIINNGIDISRFSYNEKIRNNKRKELGCEQSFIIGNVARLNDNKNQSFAIDIMQQFVKLHPNSELWFIGTGNDYEKLRQKTYQLNLTDNIRFLGVRGDVNELLQAMDVFLFPSKREGFPVSCIEAQASGLPCVFSNGFDSKTVITDNCKVLSLDEGPEKWAKVLSEFTEFKRYDTSLQIEEAGYNIRKTAKYLENFYLERQ